MDNQNSGKLFVISAPSGAGKSSLINALLQSCKYPLVFSISCTTRPIRSGDVDGENYIFIDESDFKKRINQGDFLEWANVYNHYYGTLKSQVDSQLKKGQHVILDIDVQGGAQIKKAYSHAITIFIMPPSLEELALRLKKRGTDAMDVINTRLSNAKNEIKYSSCYDYQVINNDFDTALRVLTDVISKNIIS